MRADFEAKNQQLLQEMPKFYSSRSDYFTPSFEALLRAQVGPTAHSPQPHSPYPIAHTSHSPQPIAHSL